MSAEDLPEPEEAESLMGQVLEFYLKRYNVVLKKLGHARTATQQSIQELDEAASDAPEKDSDLEVVHSYDTMWEETIDSFQKSGVSDEELEKVELILAKIPALIKKYYDILVEKDKILQQLITELESKEYQEALEVTKTIQNRADLMSGLYPSEFDVDEETQAFIINPSQMKDIL